MIYFSFWICIVSRSRKTAATSAVWPQMFLGKAANARIFLTVNRKKKFLPDAGRTPKFERSCKPQTLYMTPIK